MLDCIKNATLYRNKYKTHSESIIISTFFNPQNSPYRLKAFKHFYDSIKHLNHKIIECVIGDAKPQLEENKNIERVYTDTLLWHKESLLNKIVCELPKKYKYVFWVDADVIFTNLDWLVDGVEELKRNNIVQPFEMCVHLEKDELKPSFEMGGIRFNSRPNQRNNKVWRSFCSNYVLTSLWEDKDYNTHGHVGFAWGARRDVLDKVPLYERALIGGADHIIAHAAAGQIPHNCITKSFTENIDEVNKWSREFYDVVQGKIGYVKGDLYHIWHGDIKNREYLKRIQDFTPKTKTITEKDKNGLYVANKNDEEYIRNYFKRREVTNTDDGFLTSMMMGYMTNSTMMGTAYGGNPAGAIIGDMLNNSENNNNNQQNQSNIDNTIQNLMEQSREVPLEPVEIQPLNDNNSDTTNMSDPNTFS